MFCPRCGRPVNTEANFCGGCGLSKIEIEKYLQKTQPQQPQNAAPQQEAPKAEPAFTQPPVTEIPVAEAPVQEAPKAEPVFTEAETPAAEKTTVQEEASFAEKEAAAEAQAKTEYTAPNYNQYSYTSAAGGQQYTAQNAEHTAQQPEVKKEVPLSTVDFIWMLLISSLPLIGLVYIIYLAVQDNNINKRSFARANLIIALFSFVIAFVFVVGIIAANII